MGKKSKKQAKRRSAFEAKVKRREELKNVVNPFETRINKVKHNAVGRRIAKHEMGKPLASRGKALQKRKETLLNEYKRKDKTGKGLVDNRLKGPSGPVSATGSKNASGSELRKARLWKMKSDILLEDVKLTHKGMELTDSRLEDNFSDLDDEDPNEVDLLKRSDYVESAHFGGGEDGRPKSAKEFMDEVMDEKRKRQLEKEENVELTEKLDKEWLAVKSLISHKKNKSDDSDKTDKNAYDLLVRELQFSAKDQSKTSAGATVQEKAQEERNPLNKIQIFHSNLSLVLEESDPTKLHEHLKKIFTVEDLNEDTTNHLKQLLEELRLCDLSLKTFALLSVCSCIHQLKSIVSLTVIKFLKNFKFISTKNLSKMLVFCDLLMSVSKNAYIPEIVQFFQNCLVVCCGKRHSHLFVPSSKLAKCKINLMLEPNFANISQAEPNQPQLSLTEIFSDSEDNNLNKESILVYLLSLVGKAAKQYQELPSYPEIFKAIKQLIYVLSENSPATVKPIIEKVSSLLAQKEPKTFLFREKPRPLMLPMLEPKIVPLHRNSNNKDVKKKLMKKVKREFKGAQRELRKDAVFMKETWLKETLAKDKERKDKVKRLMGELAEERGLYKRKK